MASEEARKAAADFLESWEPGPEMTVVKLARAFEAFRAQIVEREREAQNLIDFIEPSLLVLSTMLDCAKLNLGAKKAREMLVAVDAWREKGEPLPIAAATARIAELEGALETIARRRSPTFGVGSTMSANEAFDIARQALGRAS